MQLKKDTYLQGGKYRVISTLGQGGFGITYLAEQVMAKRMVCIKEFFPKEYYNRDADSMHISLGSEGNAKMMNAYKEQFIKEAQIIATLKHPNIIPIFDVFEENNTAYYAMEYIEGESLYAKVKREGALAEDRAVKYIRDVASALRYIHKRNIMHLDVKPANIMLSKENDSAILIDFGLSKHYDTTGKQTCTTPMGISHGYAPIEQYQYGGVSTFSPVTDIYSLGATLFYLVTGRVPAEATTIGENGIGEIPGHLSASVRKAITSAMGYWRKDRPQSIDIFLAIFDKTTKKRKSRWWIWLLILIIGGAGFFVLYERDTPPNNEIWYTSVDGNIVEPYDSSAFNANIVSNTYTNGKGVIKFDGDVTTIGFAAFENCASLTSVNIPDSVTEIGMQAFSDCDNLTSVNIPDSVTAIGGWAFDSCDSLISVTIGDSVTEIGNNAFTNCYSLTRVDIGDSVTEIGSEAFCDCDSLTSVTIGDSVTTIGHCAFYECDSLTSVYCKATTPPALYGDPVFDYNGSGRKIYVPRKSVKAYKKADGWKEYADKIVGYDF